eukprot:187346-Pelagomonas_calceolata.AAC.4
MLPSSRGSITIVILSMDMSIRKVITSDTGQRRGHHPGEGKECAPSSRRHKWHAHLQLAYMLAHTIHRHDLGYSAHDLLQARSCANPGSVPASHTLNSEAKGGLNNAGELV